MPYEYAGIRYPDKAYDLVVAYRLEERAPDASFYRQMSRLGVTRDDASRLVYGLRFEPWAIMWIAEIPPPPPPEVIVTLRSREDTEATRDLGTISVDDKPYELPATITLGTGVYDFVFTAAETYEQASPFWEVRGNITVVSGPTIEAPWTRTWISIEGDGSVTAIYRKLLCREWTFTRYYKYTNDRAPSRNRWFELTVVLVFPEHWIEEDIRRWAGPGDKKLVDVCDEIMRDYLWRDVSRTFGYDEDTWGDIYESGRWGPGIIGIPSDWSRGWERATIPIECDLTKTYYAEWIVTDWTRHYFVYPRRGTYPWTIPTE